MLINKSENKNNVYLTSSLWFILYQVIDVVNNTITKTLVSSISSHQIFFLTFLLSTIMLIPFMLYNKSFKTEYLPLHICRGALLSLGLILRGTCMCNISITTVTILGYASPLYFLILAYFFLDEKIGIKKILFSLMGLLGIIVALNPSEFELNSSIFLLLFCFFIFTGMDVINKKYVEKESKINMAFYLSFFTSIFSALPILYLGWNDMNYIQILCCALLGFNFNLAIFSLLKAFAKGEATSMQTLKYLVFPMVILLDYWVFDMKPSYLTYLGASIIILNEFIIALDKKE